RTRMKSGVRRSSTDPAEHRQGPSAPPTLASQQAPAGGLSSSPCENKAPPVPCRDNDAGRAVDMGPLFFVGSGSVQRADGIGMLPSRADRPRLAPTRTVPTHAVSST